MSCFNNLTAAIRTHTILTRWKWIFSNHKYATFYRRIDTDFCYAFFFARRHPFSVLISTFTWCMDFPYYDQIHIKSIRKQAHDEENKIRKKASKMRSKNTRKMNNVDTQLDLFIPLRTSHARRNRRNKTK